uniref:non-specific serine/threonine protein kinase n=1 Tax=Macrostomum lignano TaxID=282301 RepID=A0A1I8FQS1_9PLAT
MACKIFDSKDSMSGPGFETQRQDRLRQVRKEYMMLKLVESSPHENVCKFLGVRQAGDTYFMFFELLTGGELFNHIVPDVGIPASLAKMYFVQICRAIAHLQTLGIAHRDIKCENCLLTGDLRTLKVTDFGWATIYRSQSEPWSRVAGTEPYMCPEMHVTDRPYRAEPVDYWSAGVVLIAMLTGEMPWDRAHSSEPHFVAWAAPVSLNLDGDSNSAPRRPCSALAYLSPRLNRARRRSGRRPRPLLQAALRLPRARNWTQPRCRPIGCTEMALRLTRFFTSTDAAATQEELLKALGMVSELRLPSRIEGAIHPDDELWAACSKPQLMQEFIRLITLASAAAKTRWRGNVSFMDCSEPYRCRSAAALQSDGLRGAQQVWHR